MKECASCNSEAVPTDPPPVLLSQIVRRAAEIVDPDDDDATVGDFELMFEDADEPVAALDDVQARVATALADLDPAVANGSLSMAGALTIYLSFRRDELGADDEELIRLAARAEWDGSPPTVVSDWLDERGIIV